MENFITVCSKHHGSIHGMKRRVNISTMTRKALAAKKARGEKLGVMGKVNLEPYAAEGRAKGRAALQSKADTFAGKVKPIINELRREGLSLNAIAKRLHMDQIRTATAVRNAIAR